MFNWKTFKSHSGKTLNWKIECDSLTKKDLECIANIISSKITFKYVEHPPTKSANIMWLVTMLKRHENELGEYDYLIIDDVLTTGRSMEDIYIHLAENNHKSVIGVVLFARNDCPHWIYPLFQLDKKWI